MEENSDKYSVHGLYNVSHWTRGDLTQMVKINLKDITFQFSMEYYLAQFSKEYHMAQPDRILLNTLSHLCTLQGTPRFIIYHYHYCYYYHSYLSWIIHPPSPLDCARHPPILRASSCHRIWKFIWWSNWKSIWKFYWKYIGN